MLVILGMRNFRKVTVAVLGIITLLFAADIYYLYSLYGSIKAQYIVTAADCLRQADIVDIMTGVREKYSVADSSFTASVPVAMSYRMTEDGAIVAADAGDSGGKVLGLFESFNLAVGKGLRESVAAYDIKADFARLDSLFRMELNRAGLYPEEVKVLPADSVAPELTDGMWEVGYSLLKNSPLIYRGYFSPPFAHILGQIRGIVVVTVLIILALAFAFVYLIRTVLRMKTLEEMKDDFTNNMTHELKTPIAIAYAANDTLLNFGAHNDPEKRERYLRGALAQLSRLSGLVENILSMSMERRKSICLDMEALELMPFLQEISQAHLLRAEKKVEIAIDVKPADLTIDTDTTHFGNVMNNLIDNSIKYSGPEVKIEIFADADGISVRDNGNGIPGKYIDSVFNKFFRVPDGDRQNVRGYGIGLYYVRSIIAKMGWTVAVRSRSGKGSVFTIKFNRRQHGTQASFG